MLTPAATSRRCTRWRRARGASWTRCPATPATWGLRRVLPGRVLTVRLQDWVEDFSATLRRVLAFLDLPYDPACERYYEAEREVRTVSRHQVRQPINARGIGRWREYERHLSPLIDALRE